MRHILPLVLTACGGIPSLKVQVGASCAAYEKVAPALVQAAAAWTPASITVAPGGLTVECLPAAQVKLSPNAESDVAIYDGGSNTISVSAAILAEAGDVSTVAVILEHELGHALGLGHEADPNAVMYPTFPHTVPIAGPNATDFGQLCDAGLPAACTLGPGQWPDAVP